MAMPQLTARPAGFDAYWEQVDRDLARYPAAPELEPLPLRSTEHSTAWAVRLTSVGPYRIFGYYSVPHGDGPFPALLRLPHYGSVNHVPDYEDRQRYAVLQLMHRGQRLADQPFAAAYPGLFTVGIEDPATYIYRAIAADCLRGAEFLLGRPEVDTSRAGLVGDDLAIITAARRPGFSTVLASSFLFYRLMEACLRTTAYPLEEVNDLLRMHPTQRDAVAATVSYVDPVYHAGDVRAATLLATGDDGTMGGSAWLQPLRDALGGTVEAYQITHEGGTDRDALDTWLAQHLGVEPLSRFRRFL